MKWKAILVGVSISSAVWVYSFRRITQSIIIEVWYFILIQAIQIDLFDADAKSSNVKYTV